MPVDRRTVLQNAQLFASKGQFDAAIAEWKKLTADSPADGSIFNSIGDLQLKRNATSEAITAFLQAAAAFRTEGSTLKAIAAYKKILKVDPSRYDIYRHLGDLNAERGLLSSAVQDYLTLGKHYLKEGRTKEALDVYRKIVSQDPSNLDAQRKVAELCVQENLGDEAVRVYLQLGRERSAQNRYDEAKDAYLAVLKLDPQNAEAREIIDMLQRGGGDAPLNLAKAAKPAAAQAKTGEGTDLLSEATRRIDEGQYAGAEAMLTQLLSREPGNPQICQLLARLHLLQGNVQVALGEYRFLAGAALRAQDYPLAESLITEFLKVEPNSVPILELFGELFEERGDGATAAHHFGRAVEILLEHPEPGMPTLPAELYEKIQALAPGSAIARKLAPSFDPTATVEPPAETPAAAVSEIPAPAPEPVNAEQAPKLEPEVPFRFIDPLPGAAVSAKPVATQSTASPQPKADSVPPAPVVSPPPVMAEAAPAPASAPPVAPPAPPAVEMIDSETRYSLGMAYKDMGLLDEAKEEFLLSMKDSGYFVDSCLMMALCLKEQGQSDQAIQLLEKLLGDSRCRGGNAQIVRYELGLLYEKVGSVDRAIGVYQAIPAFHDVPQRLEALRSNGSNGASHPLPNPAQGAARPAGR
ncbi:MAG: tetratricopeptide repeat protein [Nitrospiraceae bacterium]|nr:tetratricopeptide repeat protein [Nitrospiraceae bacterium]